MSYAAHRKDFGTLGCTVPTAPATHGTKIGWRQAVRRFFGRMFEPQDKQLERELSEFIARSGGHLTDNLEREMMHRITRAGVGTWR